MLESLARRIGSFAHSNMCCASAQGVRQRQHHQGPSEAVHGEEPQLPVLVPQYTVLSHVSSLCKKAVCGRRPFRM